MGTPDKPLERRIEDTMPNNTKYFDNLPSEICINHPISRDQREHEAEAGLGLEGTENFEAIGCYKCDGYNYGCGSYSPNKIEMNDV